ncbi:MAG: PBP1A family penicillin-binding protein [Spirochaetia bacterium]|jgi:penicillin-binding protein 1A|nr:PBP1A family penicillin-binding protein [Spirochaetia bacterium]
MPKYSRTKSSIGIFSSAFDSLKGVLYYLFQRFRLIIIAVPIGVAIAFAFILPSDFKKVKALAVFRPDITTKIYDKNGLLVSELFKQKREVVPLNRMPKNLVNAFIAVEDNEFYNHIGVNPKGIVRAFFVNIMAGGVRQGGSTITQQLSKVLLTSGERTIFRKIKEACIAIMMEFTYSKDEIMQLYLNQIFLGHGAYGVESAAQIYFNKHVWECTLAESALIASLPAAPNLLSPIRHPNVSMARHRIVLAKMVEMGYITVKDAETAYLAFWPDYLLYINELEPTVTAWSARVDKAPWFTEYIRRDLIKKYGDDMVYNKGLMVYTTLDLNKQRAAEKALWSMLERQNAVSFNLAFKNHDVFMDTFSEEISIVSDLFGVNTFSKRGSRENEKINSHFRTEIVEELEELNLLGGLDSIGKFIDSYRGTFSEDKDLQKVEGALISINHENGYIEAMVGGAPFTSINQLNRPMQSRRQPGSSIKPLLYAAAIESGEFTAATPVLDSPIIYLDNESGSWTPENYDGDYQGLVPLRKALAMSINVVSVRMAEKLGMDTVIKYYAKLLKISGDDIQSRIPRNLSIALGTLEVSPFELTRAYSIIANGGRDVIPFSIRYVTDYAGNMLENQEEEVKKTLQKERQDGKIQIIKPETAQLMISLLKTVIDHGTGRSASIGAEAAGKTGTTNSWRDAWFIGFVPQLTTGIWVGYDKMGLTLGRGQTGGIISAPVWGAYMKKVMSFEKSRAFPSYAKLSEAVVCEKTGLLPSHDCKQLSTEVFVPGTVPDQTCSACLGSRVQAELPLEGPKNNILKEQKQNVIKSLKNDKPSDSITNDIGDELLR